jgi:hypothetical protein
LIAPTTFEVGPLLLIRSALEVGLDGRGDGADRAGAALSQVEHGPAIADISSLGQDHRD